MRSDPWTEDEEAPSTAFYKTMSVATALIALTVVVVLLGAAWLALEWGRLLSD